MEIKRILIPVDGSSFSLEVLRYVTRFLKPDQTKVILFHVAEPPSMVELGAPGDPELTIFADQEVASVEAGFASMMQMHMRYLEHNGFSAETVVYFGEPTAEIERYIREEGVDMVAMTTHGRTGLARMLLGSVAQHVINHAAVPVLLFRPTEELGGAEAMEAQNGHGAPMPWPETRQ
ncbi:MAG: universal stress protein [Caldilineaceae bacterium]|nr:universal stress protein [Caldilineaceae bacterium]